MVTINQLIVRYVRSLKKIAQLHENLYDLAVAKDTRNKDKSGSVETAFIESLKVTLTLSNIKIGKERKNIDQEWDFDSMYDEFFNTRSLDQVLEKLQQQMIGAFKTK